jgi:hypothetical protein
MREIYLCLFSLFMLAVGAFTTHRDIQRNCNQIGKAKLFTGTDIKCSLTPNKE